jgi:hypothetical protein
MLQPAFIDLATENLLSRDKIKMIEELESQWKSGALRSEWYKLLLAVSMAEYPFHDYEVALAVSRELYPSKYRYHAAILRSFIYELHPVNDDFLPLLSKSHSPFCLYRLAYHFHYDGDIINAIKFSRLSLKYLPIPNNLRIIIKLDTSLSNIEKDDFIRLWDMHVKTDLEPISIYPSIHIYNAYWSEFISGKYKYDALKEHILADLIYCSPQK